LKNSAFVPQQNVHFEINEISCNEVILNLTSNHFVFSLISLFFKDETDDPITSNKKRTMKKENFDRTLVTQIYRKSNKNFNFIKNKHFTVHILIVTSHCFSKYYN